MNFDYTYIVLSGLIVFEPVTILTNALITAFCIFAFFRINKVKQVLNYYWARFFLFIGTSSLLGSVAHGIHYQWGSFFLNVMIFAMNAISLIAIYYCFKAAHHYYFSSRQRQGNYSTYIVVGWIIILLIITLLQNNFLLIKIHAGIVLSYSLIIHLITYKKPGSKLIAWGIIVSFLPIIVHSLHFSLSEWFNYKDIAHVIMLVSLAMIYSGVQKKMSLEFRAGN